MHIIIYWDMPVDILLKTAQVVKGGMKSHLWYFPYKDQNWKSSHLCFSFLEYRLEVFQVITSYFPYWDIQPEHPVSHVHMLHILSYSHLLFQPSGFHLEFKQVISKTITVGERASIKKMWVGVCVHVCWCLRVGVCVSITLVWVTTWSCLSFS